MNITSTTDATMEMVEWIIMVSVRPSQKTSYSAKTKLATTLNRGLVGHSEVF